MRIKHKLQLRFHRPCGRICCLPRHAYPFRRRAPLAAGPAERYKEWDASATGLGELQQRGTNHTWCAAAFDCAGDSIRNKNNENFEPFPGEMIPYAKIPANAFWFTPDATIHSAPECQASSLERIARSNSSVSDPRTTDGQLIYAVDDAPELTELYTILLEATGYVVRAFNDRAKALTALKAERTKPDLLITDCVGPSMSFDRFLECCLVVYPSLRILMVSGYSQTDVRFPRTESDRFVQKPFTVEEFLRRVRATLVT
jgi:CheY-like chemotaxis protein